MLHKCFVMLGHPQSRPAERKPLCVVRICNFEDSVIQKFNKFGLNTYSLLQNFIFLQFRPLEITGQDPSRPIKRKPRHTSHYALKSGQSTGKTGKGRYNKSQNRYISRIRAEASCEEILTKFSQFCGRNRLCLFWC